MAESRDRLSTTYRDHSHLALLSYLASAVSPVKAVEIGVQQGASGRAIASALPEHGHFWGCDLFEDFYQAPPKAPTKASYDKAKKAFEDPIIRCQWTLFKTSAENFTKLFTGDTDIVHIDICNHYDNLSPFIERWFEITNKLMLVEGGFVNHWQKAYGYKPFLPLIRDLCDKHRWSFAVIPLADFNSLTVITPLKGLPLDVNSTT